MIARQDPRRSRQYRDVLRSSTRSQQESLEAARTGIHPISSLLKSWPLLTGLFAVGFIAARLLGVSGGNLETAYAILQMQGTGIVVVGSLIGGVGLLIAPVAVISFYYAYQVRPDINRSTLGVAGGIAAAVISLANIPVLAFVTTLMISAIFYSLVWGLRWTTIEPESGKARKYRHALPSFYEVLGIYLISTLIAFLAFGYPPWFPLQNITVKGTGTFSAYIVSQNSASTFILTRDHVRIVHLPTNRITGQEFCAIGEWEEETLDIAFTALHIIKSQNGSYPACRARGEP